MSGDNLGTRPKTTGQRPGGGEDGLMRHPRRSPWRLSRRCVEGCIARTRHDLAVVPAGPLPEVWEIVQQELLEELAELELSLSRADGERVVPGRDLLTKEA